MGVSPWMNAQGGPSEAWRAPGLRSRSGRFGGVGKEGASADWPEEMKDTTGVSPWRLHSTGAIFNVNPASCGGHKTDGVSPVELRSITPQGGEAVDGSRGWVF